MPSKRGVALTSGRIVTGLVGVGVAAVTIAAAGQLSLPTVEIAPQDVLVTPVAGDQSLVCPGPLLALAQDATAATAAGSFGPASVDFGADGVTPTTTQLAAPDNTSGAGDGSPTVVTVPGASDGTVTPLSGAQSQIAAEADIAGLAAAACTPASGESWLVGGSSDIGRTTLVLLSNPSAVDANVTLDVFGTAGRVDAPGAAGIVVASNTQRVVALTGLAPNEPTPVVHVTSTGGQIVAALQQSTVRVLAPGGVEVQGPTAAPSTDLVIPGLVVTAPAAAGQSSDTAAVDDRATALRLFAPGAEAADVVITATRENSKDEPIVIDATIQPGVPGEIALAELPAGEFSLQITSDQPVVAAARSNARGGALEDFAWFGATAPLDDTASFTVPTGPGQKLHVLNPTDAEAVLTLTDANGTETTAKVAAGAAATIAVAAGRSYVMEGADGLYASISLASPGRLASLAVSPPNPLASAISVYPR
ncbi:hypothetical protein KXS11_14430 [Plantibacter flavus]|uniref:DUF5719 family protein n=1 Tax=Plantibacter flavus TaxID=150123 RepID=UPI003F188425